MAVLKRKPKIEPSKMYLALEGFASVEGHYQADMVVAGTDPVVKNHPELFIPMGASSEEISRARNERLAQARAGAASDAGPLVSSGGTPIHLPRPLPPERRMRCVKALTVQVAAQALSTFSVGKVYDAHNPAVKANPKHFEPDKAA